VTVFIPITRRRLGRTHKAGRKNRQTFVMSELTAQEIPHIYTHNFAANILTLVDTRRGYVQDRACSVYLYVGDHDVYAG